MTSPWPRQLAQMPELDAAAEADLATRARAGDQAARDELIRSCLRHVVQRAQMLGFRGHAFDDAVQAGCVGLIAAADRFDPDRGVRLRTYAWWWIGEAMRVAVPVVEDELPDVEAPEAQADALVDLGVAEVPEVLRVRFRVGEEPGPPRPRHEVATLLGMSEAQVRRVETRAMHTLRERLARVTHRAPAVEPIPHSSIGRAFDC